MPAWVVEGGATVDLPLQRTFIRDSQEAIQESIILFSQANYEPRRTEVRARTSRRSLGGVQRHESHAALPAPFCLGDIRRGKLQDAEDPKSKTTMWFLTGGLVVMAVMFSVLVYYYHHRQPTQVCVFIMRRFCM
ncbi:uncharacterized protein LOC119586631 [Penaeus monodon]|uniref:uncharacterized protein LOC119586631 n=1 Tax=Penaeus monodon TaxID=6687 RepID=UPI0018A6DFF4|nr:uncharacterized protein LOC119586631 [Penaeus monodon]